jgi:hypothetical protein
MKVLSPITFELPSPTPRARRELKELKALLMLKTLSATGIHQL